MKQWLTCVLIGLLIPFLIPTSAVSAAGSKPKLIINCGQITGGADENGTYGLFKPTISVQYYGKPLKVIAYFYPAANTPKSEAGQSIWELTGNSSARQFYIDSLSLERKILAFSQKQTGYYRIEFEATDSLKRKGFYTCQYKNYYFNTPTVLSPQVGAGSGSSNTSSQGFNKTNCTFDGKKLFGSVYFTNSSYSADFSVYIASSSYSADLNVYQTGSAYSAYACGLWYPTNSSYTADFSVYLTNSSYSADFSIYQTASSYSAGTR